MTRTFAISALITALSATVAAPAFAQKDFQQLSGFELVVAVVNSGAERSSDLLAVPSTDRLTTVSTKNASSSLQQIASIVAQSDDSAIHINRSYDLTLLPGTPLYAAEVFDQLAAEADDGANR